MKREAKLQDTLRDLIEEVARKQRFHGIEIRRVERDFPVDGRRADLVLFMRGELPFLIIETKKEGKGALFDPLDASVVGQVLSYAAMWKKSKPELTIPFVATANPDSIVIFRVPRDIEGWIDWEAVRERDYGGAIRRKYQKVISELLIGKPRKLYLTLEFIQLLLDELAKQYVEEKFIKPEPGEAMMERFRSFVKTIAEKCLPLVQVKLKEDKIFRKDVEKLGYDVSSDSIPKTAGIISRMMAYVLLNKLIFRKVLEKSHKLGAPMTSLDSSSRARFVEGMRRFFDETVERTGDFEPIFRTGVYDQIPIPDDPDLMEYINDLLFDLENVDITRIGEQIGYIYESLIPPEERHQLGQFYTPPWVCELITKWCIRSPDDTVLDPGVGSGGFLIEAYKRLLERKVGPTALPIVPKDVHERILSQLYALDINPFPAHLSAVAISMKNIRSPSTKLNVLVSDFFALRPGQAVLSPYKVKTVVGEVEREIVLPKCDAVVGNPPYTRWTEIPEETQERIRSRLGRLMREYGLTPQVSRGVEPGIYTYWIMHATDFLKEGGRLGMIISNTWLQTDYGIGFGNFLLDNFRIKAIIDFEAKLFKDALITTCIVLAEREKDERKRLENDVVFVHIPGEVESADVEKLLEVLETGRSDEYVVNVVKQREVPRDRKWIDLFFKTVDISKHPLMTKLGELFEPLRGNTFWAKWALSHGKRPDPGSSEFHYLSPSKIREFSLEKWAYPEAPLKDALIYPAITSARQTNFFTFTEEDWEELRKSDERCYMFICHKPRTDLPEEVENYVRWGETGCRTRIRGSRKGGRLASETEAAKVRAKEKMFYGWYDLGGVIPASVFAIYQARYKTRFTLCKFPVAMYHALIALVPKRGVSLNEVQTKALMAYVNSSFAQYCIERKGRYIPKGPMGLEANVAREIPVLDVRKLNDKQLGSLAKLFDELECEARKIGGASTREQIEKLKPKIYEIDRAIARILGLKDEDVETLQKQVDMMVERRVGVAKKSTEQ